MAIRIQTGMGSVVVDQAGFANEAQLQDALAATPDLLRQGDEPALALVARELVLPEAGSLDLLFVSSDGLPVAVEVKLEANGQSRREVVAQAVDYLSSLTALTNDELEELTNGNLSAALRSFEPDTAQEVFERRWAAVGANLRAGLARVLVAVDSAPGGLERIVRFLAASSELDIQLVAVERYSAPETGEVLVPRMVVSSASSQRKPAPSQSQNASPDLLEAVAAYNQSAAEELQATGTATYYRKIRPPEWLPRLGLHYEFYRTGKYLGVELHLEADLAKPLAAVLQPLAGSSLVDGAPPLVWDPSWSSGRGRLACRLPVDSEAQLVAQAMNELIRLTRPVVDPLLRQLAAV